MNKDLDYYFTKFKNELIENGIFKNDDALVFMMSRDDGYQALLHGTGSEVLTCIAHAISTFIKDVDVDDREIFFILEKLCKKITEKRKTQPIENEVH